jgi:peroxisomal membrane protein 2
MSDLAKDAWRKYLIQLQAHPLRTKAITAGVLAGCSDAIAQKISGVKRIQFRRLLLLMLYGFAYGGPFGHFFHKLMDTIFKGKKGNSTVAKKVLSFEPNYHLLECFLNSWLYNKSNTCFPSLFVSILGIGF